MEEQRAQLEALTAKLAELEAPPLVAAPVPRQRLAKQLCGMTPAFFFMLFGFRAKVGTKNGKLCRLLLAQQHLLELNGEEAAGWDTMKKGPYGYTLERKVIDALSDVMKKILVPHVLSMFPAGPFDGLAGYTGATSAKARHQLRVLDANKAAVAVALKSWKEQDPVDARLKAPHDIGMEADGEPEEKLEFALPAAYKGVVEDVVTHLLQRHMLRFNKMCENLFPGFKERVPQGGLNLLRARIVAVIVAMEHAYCMFGTVDIGSASWKSVDACTKPALCARESDTLAALASGDLKPYFPKGLPLDTIVSELPTPCGSTEASAAKRARVDSDDDGDSD